MIRLDLREFLEEIIFIRAKEGMTPRKKLSTSVPRVSRGLERDIEPIFQRALNDYKRYYDEVVPEVMEKYGKEPIGQPPFPHEDPTLRVTDQIMGSKQIQGLNVVEKLNGVHSVVNLSQLFSHDAYDISLHELFHNSLSQRGIDYGETEERMADDVAREISQKTGGA